MTVLPRFEIDELDDLGIIPTQTGGQLLPGDGLPVQLTRHTLGSHSSAIGSTVHHMLILSKRSRGHLVAEIGGERCAQVMFDDSIIFAPAGASHSYEFEGETDNLIATLDASFISRLLGEWGPGISAGAFEPKFHLSNPRINHLMLEMYRAFDQRTAGWRITAEACSMQIAVELFRTFHQAPRPARRRSLSDNEMRAITEYIEAFIDQEIGLSDLAALVDMDIFGFSRAFKEHTNKPPGRFLLERRVENACKLLRETNQPISEIAFACGFSSQAHLTTTFRKYVGTTPARYRRGD